MGGRNGKGQRPITQVRLLGRAELQRGTNAAVHLRGGARMLFAYLALRPERPARRELIVDTLWQDASPAAGRKLLRTALWRLGKGFELGPALTSDRDWIALQPGAGVGCDIWDVDAAYATAASEDQISAATAEHLRAAAELYRGDFLEETDAEWCLVPREKYRLMYLTILERLVEFNVEQGAYAQALLRCQQLLARDAANEWAHRQLMGALHLTGNRTAALRHYEVCRQALARELGVAPSRSTESLAAHIRADGGAPLPDPMPPPAAGQQRWVVELRQHLVQIVRLIDAHLA